MADFSYTGTADQDALLDRVEYHSDLVLKNEQTIGADPKRVYENCVTGMQHVLNGAQRHALDEEATSGDGQAVSNDRSYTEIVLPEDFLMFMELLLAGWKKHIAQLTDREDRRVDLQYEAATRADPQHPLATKVPAPGDASGQKLRCWPQDSGPSIETFTYVPEKPPEEVGGTLREPITMWGAYYTMAAGKYEGAATMQQAAIIYLRSLNAGERMTAAEAVRQAEQDS